MIIDWKDVIFIIFGLIYISHVAYLVNKIDELEKRLKK